MLKWILLTISMLVNIVALGLSIAACVINLKAQKRLDEELENNSNRDIDENTNNGNDNCNNG